MGDRFLSDEQREAWETEASVAADPDFGVTLSIDDAAYLLGYTSAARLETIPDRLTAIRARIREQLPPAEGER